ncbi:MAG TPA: IPT/TIG domain-containing protein [Candidatus Acidoferrales bacterium]|nr:IPT/TIG domain-containing protein [Candidatus Acidoferrales bacterium]
MRIRKTSGRATKSVQRATLIFYAAIAAILMMGCGAVSGGKSGSSSGSGSGSGGSNPSVTISPTGANLRVGGTQQFTATVTGEASSNVAWSVNGTVGGSATSGMISTAGLYTAPPVVPSPNAVTIEAVSASDSSLSSSVTVDVLNPIPSISGIQPSPITTGAFSITVSGSNFVAGAQVTLAGSALTTAFVSSTQLTATGNASTAGTFAVTVVNPNPGSASSNSVNLQVNSTVNTSACSQISLGQGASLNGFIPFPSDNAWNTDISAADIDPNSAAYINFIGPSVILHPDFGSGEYDGSSIGIPYVVVGAGQAFVPIDFTAYGDESDPGPMPVPSDAPIEGYPNPGSGDRHVLVLDNSNCWLYELYSSYPNSDGSWNAASAAVWDLLNNEQRPYTWTSADAAGLSIFAGLVRYDEVASGAIHHAIRFTLQNSQAAFVLPATHWAATSTNSYAAPMGMRLRLKASFDISGFSATNQVILTALQQYGMIMADNGSSMYISGAPDDNWNNSDLHLLDGVTASDFEVVKMDTIYTASNVPQGAAPTINSFTASATTVSAGTPVTLNWSTTSASYLIVSPEVGATRGTSVSVTPSATTAYTLYATNAFGRSTATLTVTVQ